MKLILSAPYNLETEQDHMEVKDATVCLEGVNKVVFGVWPKPFLEGSFYNQLIGGLLIWFIDEESLNAAKAATGWYTHPDVVEGHSLLAPTSMHDNVATGAVKVKELVYCNWEVDAD